MNKKFEEHWQWQQGALFLKQENHQLEWRKSLAEFFYQKGLEDSAPANGTLVPTDKLKEMQARLEELENEVGLHSGELIGQEHRLGTMYESQILKLQKRLESAEKALRYYADGWHYRLSQDSPNINEPGPHDVEIETGEKARAYFERYNDQK